MTILNSLLLSKKYVPLEVEDEVHDSPVTKYIKTRDSKKKPIVEEEEVNLYESDDSIDKSLNGSYGASPEDNFSRNVRLMSEAKAKNVDYEPSGLQNISTDKNVIKSFANVMSPEIKGIRLRADDTMHDMRKSNLSLENSFKSSGGIKLPLVKEVINELFGEELVEYFQTYFDKFLSGVEYKCDQNMCCSGKYSIFLSV